MKKQSYTPVVKPSDVNEGDIVLFPWESTPEYLLPYLNPHTHNGKDYVAAYVFQQLLDKLSLVPLDHQMKGTKKTGTVMYDMMLPENPSLFICEGEELEYGINNRFAYRDVAKRIFRNFLLDELLADI